MMVGQQTTRRRNKRWEELDKRSIPIEQLIRHYEVYNRSEGKSPRTVSWYTDCLTTFTRFLQDETASIFGKDHAQKKKEDENLIAWLYQEIGQLQ